MVDEEILHGGAGHHFGIAEFGVDAPRTERVFDVVRPQSRTVETGAHLRQDRPSSASLTSPGSLYNGSTRRGLVRSTFTTGPIAGLNSRSYCCGDEAARPRETPVAANSNAERSSEPRREVSEDAT